MLKQKILPVQPLIQCEAGRAKTKLFCSPGTPNGRRVIKIYYFFYLFVLLFSAIRSHLSELSLFVFPLLRKTHNRKDNKALRYVIFVSKISKFRLKFMLTFFPIQTFVNSNCCNITPSNAKGQSHVSRNETRSLCNSRQRQ